MALLFRWIDIPTDRLVGSPFGSYTLPSILLIVLVGGSGLLAAALVLRRSSWALAVSGSAGVVIVAFAAVELVAIGFSWFLTLYIAIGLVIFSVAAGLWLTGDDGAYTRRALAAR